MNDIFFFNDIKNVFSILTPLSSKNKLPFQIFHEAENFAYKNKFPNTIEISLNESNEIQFVKDKIINHPEGYKIHQYIFSSTVPTI